MNRSCYLLILVACIAIAGCGDEKKPAVKITANARPALMEPFRYHKAIEVSPGQTYDIVSWGRGSSAVGAFAILHSDSSGMSYSTTTGKLDGAITDVYNADMDLDGNPEILIQSKGKDTVNYAKIYAFEFNNDDANKLDFPKLTSSQKRGYRGNDNFYIKEGKLIREFPIYDGNTVSAKPTGAKRQLEYSLHGNDFTVKQLSRDSVSVREAQPVIKKSDSEKKHVSRKSRKHKETKHSKRKHRRHRR
jgi:hypothetical protein